MIKHLFSDMDGTVLNSKGEISEANINAIKKSELPFTLVSARSPQKMENIINTLGIDGIHVSFNGALIFKKKNNKKRILHRQPLDFSLAKNLVLDIRDNIIDFKEYFKEEKDIYKVSFIEYDNETFEKIVDHVQKQYSNEELTFQRSLNGYLEITHLNAKKSKGIEFISDLEKLTKNELAAFGDGQNDIPMFETVGYSVVMGNASDDVKKYADYVTKSNNEDGVAYAIENFIK